MRYLVADHPRQSLTVNIHCEFSSRFHSDSKRIRSGFVWKRRESPRIHNVFAQQYGFANFGRVFTVIHCETLSWAGANVCAQYVLSKFATICNECITIRNNTVVAPLQGSQMHTTLTITTHTRTL